MGDLVARLRDHKAMSVDWDVLRAERDEAADEIERLTSALDGVRRCTNYHECDCRERVTKALRGAVETAPALWRGAELLQLKCLCCILVET